MNKTSFWNTLLVTFSLGLAFAAGYVSNDFVEQRTHEYPLLQEAIGILEKYALEPLPGEKGMEYGMIRGLLQAYDDPYTIFLEPPQHELQTNQLEGAFGGIGVKIERGEDRSIVLYPFPDGPGFEAGLLNGDRLVSVDELLATPETTIEAIEATFRGPVGEKVKVVITRMPEGEPLTFMIERRKVALPSVIWHPVHGVPEVGMLQVTIIAQTTPDEIVKAVAALQKQGVKYFILDLRGNGGGILDAGVDTARLFLKEGIIIEQQYRGEAVEQLSVTRPGPLAEIPVVVLVNHNTASAAEIIAGALQANGRAALMGEPTYGKDTVQLVFQLQDGSSLHITAAHWWFPGLDFPLEGIGLNPTLMASDEDWVRDAVDFLLQGVSSQ